jgi:hypothetical protein
MGIETEAALDDLGFVKGGSSGLRNVKFDRAGHR